MFVCLLALVANTQFSYKHKLPHSVALAAPSSMNNLCVAFCFTRKLKLHCILRPGHRIFTIKFCVATYRTPEMTKQNETKNGNSVGEEIELKFMRSAYNARHHSSNDLVCEERKKKKTIAYAFLSVFSHFVDSAYAFHIADRRMNGAQSRKSTNGLDSICCFFILAVCCCCCCWSRVAFIFPFFIRVCSSSPQISRNYL